MRSAATPSRFNNKLECLSISASSVSRPVARNLNAPSRGNPQKGCIALRYLSPTMWINERLVRSFIPLLPALITILVRQPLASLARESR
jgi:hypothetical protein